MIIISVKDRSEQIWWKNIEQFERQVPLKMSCHNRGCVTCVCPIQRGPTLSQLTSINHFDLKLSFNFL